MTGLPHSGEPGGIRGFSVNGAGNLGRRAGAKWKHGAGRTPGSAAVGDNEPYRIEPEEHDYTVHVLGGARGLDAAPLELRQDLVASAAEAEAWAARLAPAFADVPGGSAAARG